MGGWELMHRHKLVGRDGVISVEHVFSEVAHDWFSCKMEVAEHLVRLPAAEEPSLMTRWCPFWRLGGSWRHLLEGSEQRPRQG